MFLRVFEILLLCFIDLFLAQSNPINLAYQNYDYFYEGDVLVQFADPTQDGFQQHQNYSVSCGKDAMKVILPSGSFPEVIVLSLSGMYPIQEDVKACGYFLTMEEENNVLHVSFSGCHLIINEGTYTLKLMYYNEDSPTEIATLSCDAKCNLVPSQKRIRRSKQPSFKCSRVPISRHTFSPRRKLPQNFTLGGCNIPIEQRLACGPADNCLKNDCCVDSVTSACYYPMDECTADKTFVFTIYSNITSIPINPKSLVVGAKSTCKPVRFNDEFAVFKFSVTQCGTYSYRIGGTTIYMAIIHTEIKSHNLKYGIITRDHPITIMVECRYSEVGTLMARASTGYMVMNPTLPSVVRADGLYGVQLRIANDETFTSFSPNHKPLNVLLGKPLYLEVRLNSRKPEATLLVNYCVAYPRSATSALVLLFEGCPNPLDSDNISVLYMGNLTQNRHRRRFVVKAFQFMDQATNKYLMEEIYFMCATEVCLPSATPCRETCFDGKS